MNVIITARHFKLPDDLREYVEKKVRRLDRYYDGIVDIEVIMGWEKQLRYVELIINVYGKQIILKEISEDLRKSFDLVLDKAKRQLKLYKEKMFGPEKDVVSSA